MSPQAEALVEGAKATAASMELVSGVMSQLAENDPLCEGNGRRPRSGVDQRGVAEGEVGPHTADRLDPASPKPPP